MMNENNEKIENGPGFDSRAEKIMGTAKLLRLGTMLPRRSMLRATKDRLKPAMRQESRGVRMARESRQASPERSL